MTASLRSRLDADHEFRVRMVLALALVVVLPFVFVYTFVVLANLLGAAVSVPPLLLTVGILAVLALQYRVGPRAAIKSVGARRARAEEFPDLHASATRIAAQADTTKPDLAVSTTDLPNTFAVDGGDRAIVVTTGLLERLDEEELDAVLAHELAHLQNRDASLMTMAWLLPAITYRFTRAVFAAFYHVIIAYLDDRSSGHVREALEDDTVSRRTQRRRIRFVARFIASLFVALTPFALFWVASTLVYLVLSRYREYAADRAAATITGSPAALASALEKLDGTLSEVPDEDLRRFDGGTEALYFAPIESRSFDSDELPSTDIFPDTHPPTEERIERLRELARSRV